MAESDKPLINGWREALVSVHDLDAWADAYTMLGDWEIRHQGPVSQAMLTLLGLPDNSTAEELLLAERNSEYGFCRLIRFDTAPDAPLIRSNARPWETGGWFDLNARVADMQLSFDTINRLGWSAESDPVEWQFGEVIVKEWLVRGPDGVVLALIERVDPPLPAAEQPGNFSKHINATQIVTDITAAREFYQQVLGFKPLIEVNDEFFIPEPASNVLGLPAESAAKQKWNISLQAAPGADGGWIEILSLPGISGRDFSALTDPPNRGILSLRFPVDDPDALQQHLLDHSITVISECQNLMLEPYGQVRMFTARGPHGARLDFFNIR